MKQKFGINAKEKPWLKLMLVVEIDYIAYK